MSRWRGWPSTCSDSWNEEAERAMHILFVRLADDAMNEQIHIA
jgi:hypothetical protein